MAVVKIFAHYHQRTIIVALRFFHRLTYIYTQRETISLSILLGWNRKEEKNRNNELTPNTRLSHLFSAYVMLCFLMHCSSFDLVVSIAQTISFLLSLVIPFFLLCCFFFGSFFCMHQAIITWTLLRLSNNIKNTWGSMEEIDLFIKLVAIRFPFVRRACVKTL